MRRWRGVLGCVALGVAGLGVALALLQSDSGAEPGPRPGPGPEAAEPENAPPGMVSWSEVEPGPAPEASAGLLRRGAIVYGARCSSCHGREGRGDGPASLWLESAPRNFTLHTFRFRTTTGFPTDADLFRSITAGFPAYGMPSFRTLPAEDRWALVAFVKKLAADGWMQDFLASEGVDGTFTAEEVAEIRAQGEEILAGRMAPGELVPAGTVPPPTPASVARGRELYVERCLSCHGPSGRGDGPSAPDLRDERGNAIRPRDFTVARIYRKAGWHSEDLVRVFQTGLPGTPMPAFDVSREERFAIAHYVETLIRDAREAAEE